MSKSSEKVKRWRKATKQRIIDSFGGKCGICGYEKCPDALALHHLNPLEKEFGLGGVRANIVSWAKICVELKKCVLLCNNCHSEVHAGLTVVPKDIVRFDASYEHYMEKERENLYDICPICGGKKRKYLITCSRECAHKRKGKIPWGNFDIIDLVENQKLPYVHIADLVGCSDVAVKKRYDKLKKTF